VSRGITVVGLRLLNIAVQAQQDLISLVNWPLNVFKLNITQLFIFGDLGLARVQK
jgi:hypothetical protein